MKRLPKIEDTKLMTRIARLQSNTDFIDFREWLLIACKIEVVDSMKDSVDDRVLHQCQGFLQVITDLNELFLNAEDWSLNMQQLAIKKTQKGR